MPESLVFSCAKILFLISLLFVAVKDRSLLFKFLFILVCIKTHDSKLRGQEEAAVRDE